MIKSALSALTSIINGYESEKKKLFDNHVDPLMKDLHIIHHDYISAFIEVRSSLNNEKVPTSIVLDFLEERRHELIAQRSMTKTLAIELKKAERRIVRNNAWRSFEEFCDSVVDYLGESNSISNASWYSDFIRFMKVSRLCGLEEQFFNNNRFGNNPRLDVINHINILIEQTLPKKLEIVQARYAELRSFLL